MKIKELKKGDFFKKNEKTKVVLIRGEYDRESKKYECGYADDCSRSTLIDGSREIFTEFEY